MVAIPSLASRPQLESPDVEFDGRRFPSRWEEPKEQSNHRLHKLVVAPDQNELPDQLAKYLLSRLPWATVFATESNTQTLVSAYVDSLLQLGHFRSDVDRLMKVACKANVEFRQASGETHKASRDAALQDQLNGMLKSISSDWLPARNVLSATLVSKPASELRQRLGQALQEELLVFTNQLFASFARFVELEVFGLVEWLPNNCCSYHFFKRVVIQTNDGASRTVEELRFSRITERDRATGRQIIGKKTTKVTRGRGQHIVRFARHQHDVMNAVHTSIRNSTVVMPPQVVRLCDAIPDWLERFVRIIDGTIFRERIIERDVEVTNWQDVEIHDEPIIGCEPGVIIGPFVLTGWGPREVKAEELRREARKEKALTDARVKQAKLRVPILSAIATALTVVAVVQLIRSLQADSWGFAATLAAIGALVCAWQAAFDYATSRRNPTATTWANLVAASISCGVLLVVWGIARLFQPMAWPVPAALAAGAIAFHFLSRRFNSKRS